MKTSFRTYGYLLVILFFSSIAPAISFGQEGVVVMTLVEKQGSTVVTMNRGQLAELAREPGILLLEQPTLTMSTQIAIPMPFSLGGGFLVGTPAAFAAALNATGITTQATTEGIQQATTARDVIREGASIAATKVTTGVQGGTVAVKTLVAAGIVGGIIAVANNSTTTTHH
ncbi:MAG: hypothetical protein GY721_03500 [Deltaproteobacteria bacterium]|nr:hypothetical protein [Deltaproteobacteria bacterium]